MPPYTVDGTFTALLSESEKAALEQQRVSRLLGEASFHLGRYTGNPAAVANDHAGRAKAVVTGLYETTLGVARALDQASKFSDPDLSPEGLAEARSERRKAVFEAVNGRIESLAPHLDAAYRGANATADPYRPKFNPDDVAQAVRTDQAWARAVQPQLDQGKGWDQIIPTLDHDGLLAVERFAPGHEVAKRGRFEQHEVPSSLEGIKRMSERRVLESAPEGPAREALKGFDDVRKYRDAALASIAALNGVSEAGTSAPSRINEMVTTAQIHVKRAAFEVGAQPTSPAA
jgi:hypothetical protein